MKTPTQNTLYRTKKEIADYFRVSISTIEKWTRINLIPVVRYSTRKNLYRIDRCQEALSKLVRPSIKSKDFIHAEERNNIACEAMYLAEPSHKSAVRYIESSNEGASLKEVAR